MCSIEYFSTQNDILSIEGACVSFYASGTLFHNKQMEEKAMGFLSRKRAEICLKPAKICDEQFLWNFLEEWEHNKNREEGRIFQKCFLKESTCFVTVRAEMSFTGLQNGIWRVLYPFLFPLVCL